MNRKAFIKQSTLSGLSWCLPGWLLKGAGAPGPASNVSSFLKIIPDKAFTGFDFFSIDTLGKNQLSVNVALKEEVRPPTGAPKDTVLAAPAAVGAPIVWELDTHLKSFTLSSRYHPGYAPPFVFNIDQQVNHATLLGIMSGAGPLVDLPAILHFPDMGTLRVTCNVPGRKAEYHTQRFIDHPYVKVLFPAATVDTPKVTYHFEVVSIHPAIKGIENDDRYDCFRKNFISIFQLNPFLKVLANNSASDACVFTLYLYSEVALRTPPLAKGLTALDLIGMTLDRYLGGQKGYGLLGYDYDKTWDIPESATSCNSLDAYPSLLIAACNYMKGTGDWAWFEGHAAQLSGWADKMLKTDSDGDGLLEFCLSGNSGSWKGNKSMRPANWWDVIGFGNKDAYANALAYRALVMLEELYRGYGKSGSSLGGSFLEKADLFRDKAALLKEWYARTFYNPNTGVLGGWESADGALHDYYFTFVNSIAVCYGLIETDMANKIMDALLLKMKEVGFTDFRLGLPGNLIPIRRADYTDLLPEAGGGTRDDNEDGFQIYENGGASACFAYYTVTALQQLGRHEEADEILLPLLKSMSEGNFQGRCPNGRTKDWKTWKGECWGYEGFLADNYMLLLSVLGRRMSILLVLLTAFFAGAAAQTGPPPINTGFESGLTGWTVTGQPGNVRVDTGHAYKGTHCAVIGKGGGGLMQRLDAAPLSLVSYSIYVQSPGKDSTCQSFIRFYNASDSLLLGLAGKVLFPSASAYTGAGNYTETPPGASYMTIGVEKGAGDGTVYVDELDVTRNIGAHRHAPGIDEDSYLKPFWSADTIVNETVLLLSADDRLARGRLLFKPDKILSVRSFDLDTTYAENKDYILHGNTLIRTAGSKMPYRADTSFDTRKDLSWFNLQSQWVVVTYTHKDKWSGPIPPCKGDKLPRLMGKLKVHAPVTIVAYGMSITRGMDVSGYDNVPPYTPNYMDLMVHGLKTRYGYTGITLYNAGLPGAPVTWGAEYAGQYVNPLKPDLVIVDFGMNDFWSYTPQAFKEYIRTILRKVRSANPFVEFLLVANMKFDPGYILDTDKNKAFYIDNMQGYRAVLQGLETEGVAEMDMNTISDFLYRRKKAKDCIANPLHPNDYLSRWYAQVMVKALSAP